MRRRDTGLVAGFTAVLVLVAGAPSAAATSSATKTLRRVDLATDGFGGWAGYVNARGQSAGYVFDGEGSPRPVLWRRYDRPVELGPPGRGPHGLNNRGDVLGENWYWSGGRVVPLEHPSLAVSATDINDRRQVVGSLEGLYVSETTAFLWQDGQFNDLRGPEGTTTRAYNVNNRGDVLGQVSDDTGSPTSTFVWRDGVMTVFSGPPDGRFDARDINDRGQVIGNSETHPFLWHRGRLTDLMAGRPDEHGAALDINDAGDVVGSLGFRPVLWRDGRAIHLVPARWFGDASAVNERGDVAGTLLLDEDDRYERRVFLWRDGRVFLSDPVFGGETSVVAAGLDERGRITGGIDDGRTGNHPAVWIAPW